MSRKLQTELFREGASYTALFPTGGTTNQVPYKLSNTDNHVGWKSFGTAADIDIDTDVTLAANSDIKVATQKAVKAYVDAIAQGLDPKASVKVATTANITLSGEQTIDGVTTSASRVLVKNQSTASQNGIYVSNASTWTRATDFDNWAEIPSAYFFVEEGTVGADTSWVCTNNSGGTLGSTSITFVQFSGAGTYTASNGVTKSGNDFQLTGNALALHNLSIADDTLTYNTGSGSYATVAFNSVMRTFIACSTQSTMMTTGLGFSANAVTLVQSANYSAMRTALGLTIGSNVQAYHVNLAQLSGLSLINDRLPYANGTNSLALTPFTSMGRTMAGLADAAAGRTALSLGTVATLNIDTDGTLAANSDSIIATQKAVKAYVDSAVQGLDTKASVKVATTANITLSGEQTIDGVTTSASRVLVKNQSTASQNGIYLSSSGSWTRTNDADSWIELVSAFTFVEEGTLQGNTSWTCGADAGGTLGSTSVPWVQFSSAGTYTGSNGITLSGSDFRLTGQALDLHNATLSNNQFIYKNNSGTITTATVTAFALTLLDDTNQAGMIATLGIGTAGLLAADTSTSLSANSNSNIPTQAAVKAYVDAVSTTVAGLPTATSTTTLTNKRITKRVGTLNAPSSPMAWDSNNYDQLNVTGLSNALTISADSGSPTDGQEHIFRFKDNGTGRALTWTTGANKSFRNMTSTAPTTTVANKTTYVACRFNNADNRWDIMAVGTEA